MNFFWCGLVVVSFIFAAINGRMDETVSAMFSGAAGAIEIVLSFAGIMCLWNGLLLAASESGLAAKIKKLLMPLIRLMFPKLDEDGEAVNYITLNITANLLGTGNGATPMGICAMKELKKLGGDEPTEEMCVFAVLNTTAFQLIPSSIIALRSAAGSTDAFSIIVPVWICSGVGVICAVASVKLMFLTINKKSAKSKVCEAQLKKGLKQVI